MVNNKTKSYNNGVHNKQSPPINLKSNDINFSYLSDDFKEKIKSLGKKKSKTIIEIPKQKEYNIIKINDFKDKNILKYLNLKKVINIEYLRLPKKKIFFNKNVDIYNNYNWKYLNKIALKNIKKDKNTKVRKYSSVIDKYKLKKIHLNKDNYKKYKVTLNKYAIDKLYNMLAPRESKEYKLYKYSLWLSGVIISITFIMLLNWFVQGIQVTKLNDFLKSNMVISTVTSGELYNMKIPGNLDIDSENKDSNNKLDEENLYWRYIDTPLASVDFEKLKKINSDTVAWLIVNNTNVNYPVVQTNNNSYYLTHSFDKSRNNAGWVFADARNNFNALGANTVIYAHGRKDKVMFGSLINALEVDWYTNYDNQIIQLSTVNYNTMWQIFSIYKIESESYYITTDFSNDDSFNSFIKLMKDRSIYDFGIDVNNNDKLLTLSTCYNNDGGRLVIQAKLVKIQKRA